MSLPCGTLVIAYNGHDMRLFTTYHMGGAPEEVRLWCKTCEQMSMWDVGDGDPFDVLAGAVELAKRHSR